MEHEELDTFRLMGHGDKPLPLKIRGIRVKRRFYTRILVQYPDQLDFKYMGAYDLTLYWDLPEEERYILVYAGRRVTAQKAIYNTWTCELRDIPTQHSWLAREYRMTKKMKAHILEQIKSGQLVIN